MRGVLVGVGILGLCLAAAGDGKVPGGSRARFEGKDTLLRPEGYREWVFVGSSLGLRYDAEAKKGDRLAETFKNVYINPESYRAFRKTGEFPEGTVTVLEVFSKEEKREPGLQGSFAKKRVSLAASVKDSRRFADGWAYYSFDGPGGTLKDKAVPHAREACWSCHHEKGGVDHVFTQFYPILNNARPGAKK
jgi:hypothetical protein